MLMFWSPNVAPCRAGHGACKAAARAPPLHRRLRRGGTATRASRDDAASSSPADDEDDVPAVPREGSLSAAARFERLYEDERTPEERETEALRLAALKAEIQWSIDGALGADARLAASLLEPLDVAERPCAHPQLNSSRHSRRGGGRLQNREHDRLCHRVGAGPGTQRSRDQEVRAHVS